LENKQRADGKMMSVYDLIIRVGWISKCDVKPNRVKITFSREGLESLKKFEVKLTDDKK
jgi:hypothetical protein